MKEDKCILCGRAFPTGLHVMGCLICFPCEKRLLGPCVPDTGRRGLARLYVSAGRGKKYAVFPRLREQNRALFR